MPSAILNQTITGVTDILGDDLDLPDQVLARGVDVLGSVRITDPDGLLDLIAEGGAALHFLGRSAEKIVLPRKPSAKQASVA